MRRTWSNFISYKYLRKRNFCGEQLTSNYFIVPAQREAYCTKGIECYDYLFDENSEIVKQTFGIKKREGFHSSWNEIFGIPFDQTIPIWSSNVCTRICFFFLLSISLLPSFLRNHHNGQPLHHCRYTSRFFIYS